MNRDRSAEILLGANLRRLNEPSRSSALRFARQRRKRSVYPLRERLFVIQVAVCARGHALRSELLQPLVHSLSESAELRVVRVT